MVIQFDILVGFLTVKAEAVSDFVLPAFGAPLFLLDSAMQSYYEGVCLVLL